MEEHRRERIVRVGFLVTHWPWTFFMEPVSLLTHVHTRSPGSCTEFGRATTGCDWVTPWHLQDSCHGWLSRLACQWMASFHMGWHKHRPENSGRVSVTSGTETFCPHHHCSLWWRMTLLCQLSDHPTGSCSRQWVCGHLGCEPSTHAKSVKLCWGSQKRGETIIVTNVKIAAQCNCIGVHLVVEWECSTVVFHWPGSGGWCHSLGNQEWKKFQCWTVTVKNTRRAMEKTLTSAHISWEKFPWQIQGTWKWCEFNMLLETGSIVPLTNNGWSIATKHDNHHAQALCPALNKTLHKLRISQQQRASQQIPMSHEMKTESTEIHWQAKPH